VAPDWVPLVSDWLIVVPEVSDWPVVPDSPVVPDVPLVSVWLIVPPDWVPVEPLWADVDPDCMPDSPAACVKSAADRAKI
jgi:hypothetical protein